MAQSFLDSTNGAMFVQWRCDLHFEGPKDLCNRVPGDPGYCSSGCTFMMVTANTELKWQVDDPAANNTCPCDDDCEHSIKKEEFDQLKEGLMVNALWPFNGNHYYPARIVFLQHVYWFPNQNERKKLPIVETKTIGGKPQWTHNGRKLQQSDLGTNVYCAYDEENCQVWVKNGNRDQKIIENSNLRPEEVEELATLNQKLFWLKQTIAEKKKA